MAKILFVSRAAKVRFRELDYQILKQEHTVSRFNFMFTPLSIFLLFFEVRKNDLVFCWFAGLWSFFAVLFSRMLKRKSIVVAAGFDVANVPEINYGLSNSLFHTLYARYALNNCDLVLPISKSNYGETLAFAKPKRCELLYCGIELKQNAGKGTKKKQVLTVGAVNKFSSLRKGHFRFIEIARRLPDVPFILIGRQKDKTIDTLRNKATPNVTFYDFLPDEELDNIFAQSKVYLQLSYHEAFGLSVVESMSMGCTPIVSNSGSLPEIVGDCGVVVEPDDYDSVAEKVKEVFEHWPDYNEKGSERAVQFDIKIRGEKLLKKVNEVISEQNKTRRDNG